MTQDFFKVDYEKAFARFWSRVWIRDVDECWPWNGATTKYKDRIWTVASYPYANPDYKPGERRTKYKQMPAQRMAGIAMGMCGINDIVENTCTDPLCCNPRHLFVAGYKEDGAVVFTAPYRYNTYRKHKLSPGESLDAFSQALLPLTQEKVVILSMDDPRMRVVKKLSAPKKKAVVLVPGTLMGMTGKVVLISVVGSGSAVMNIDQPKQVANLVLAGMPARLAGILMEKLHRIFLEI